ncbi:quinolinate synthase NadA [Lacticaseibacillus camelliae]|uniref:Quinolinate synthase n=1 Tax=Lacticaseibacillus camelliae DSM 22697 = JCM 13995 TaxID=1423730 RepID=A0A0R2FAB9_9LACO|nr:quinolinate synthase NadA [Lacticaseibacillus camelliae]KRN23349.1 quinolinate synthetase complex, A subunit [Lacticaseibacillus camelliae DSM 22697 = JCM 13995]
MLLTELKQKQDFYRYYDEAPQAQIERILAIKARFGDRLLLVAHHYQKDEVFQFADATGDSLKLAQIAASNHTAEKIVFCGVHFMAETADILTSDDQTVILPDPMAGCSMADMANSYQLTTAWQALTAQYGSSIMPVTYVNSTAAIKAFVGEHGGVVVTSGNAPKIVAWALQQAKHVLFLPDQYLGRNTAMALGVPDSAIGLWNAQDGRLENPGDYRVILWNGYCSVHQQFSVAQIDQLRAQYPGIKIIVHAECKHEVVTAADAYGSTGDLIHYIQQAPKNTRIAVGTDNNLVGRLIKTYPEKRVMALNPYSCACILMNRIDLPHLAWTMDQLAAGKPANVITVAPQTAQWAKKALDRMLALS